MKEKFQKLNKNIKDTICKVGFIEEIVFFIGLFIIIFANFLLNLYLGMYFLGFVFIAYSIFSYKVRR